MVKKRGKKIYLTEASRWGFEGATRRQGSELELALLINGMAHKGFVLYKDFFRHRIHSFSRVMALFRLATSH